MEIFDAFCGVGPWAERDPLLPYRPEEILGLMDHFGIDRALVRAHMASGRGRVSACNRMIGEICAAEERFVPAFTLSPHPYNENPSPNDYARMMADVGAQAAWLTFQTIDQSSGFSAWLMGDLIKMCARKKIPVFVHADKIGPDALHDLCGEFPSLRVILTGAGYGSDKWLFELLRLHHNLYVCLGHYYIPSGGPMRFLKHFSCDRLLFGSGLPAFSPGGLIAHVMYADITPTEQEKILSKNLQRILSEVDL
ncbi:MAG: amidohydrolase family protein [Planctomycetes bacterium]|nr:amidohydrolase family protein [Planctomycetota bacterium]